MPVPLVPPPRDAPLAVHAERLAWHPAGPGEPLPLDVAALHARAVGPATEATVDD